MKPLGRLLPDTLGGRIVLVLLVGLMAFHLGSLWLHQIGTEAVLGTTREAQLAERLVAAKRAVAELPIEERDRTAHALSTASLDMHWTRAATVQPVRASSARIEALRSRLGELVPEFDITGLRLGYGEDGMAGHQLLGALPLPDGSWLNFSAALFRPPASEHATLLSTTAMALGILLLGLLVVRLIGRPLRALSDAADRFGGPGAVVPVPEEGPREVRQAAQAFNRMQGRIDRLIADRTQALAAVSHDLRTPIARLRLRAGFVEDGEAARAIDADLDEMEAMIDSTLAYLRGETESEPRKPADIVAMIETLCDAAADAGAAVTYAGPTQARLVCSPVTLKRAFANLIDNAVNYGGGARVVLEDKGQEILVRIEDDGPGIPDAEMQAVFEPFRRLETSRNRGTGGSGLGLTIARRAVEQQGGTVQLSNRPAGGLLAFVRLPRIQG
ncbi:ATP-binding protein [Falsiroseomonas selenitidurans]|uniref:histidine kinase n=1 Tax=Falsiroseomonas selenitidurans TaxID=2716335 RepID=A0ABX1E8C4_9PROT|nr:ATP-binding protein [Falsiroseomonas selenitidurans]NKC31135.1 HAMP domain-containing protein [Falsiroseomonas selenitidurans]